MSRFTWTVGRKLAALAGTGMVTTAATAVIALGGMQSVEQHKDDLVTMQDARTDVRLLDTRASELKATALKALLAAQPRDLLADIDEDGATARGLVADLDSLNLGEVHTDIDTVTAVAPLEAATETYVRALTEVIERAAVTPAADPALTGQVQEVNDAMDEAVGVADEALSQARDDLAASLQRVADREMLFTSLITVVGLVLLAGIAYLIARSIVRPLRGAVAALEKVAAGDLTVTVAHKSAGEVGTLEKALNESVQSMLAVVSAVASSADAVASSAQELAVTSEQIAAGAEETSAQAGVVATAAEQVSRSTQTVATGAEQVDVTTREIARATSDATRIAAEGVAEAETANGIVSSLGTSSNEIGNVVKVITSIAEQTNLLALNATIEAARAGEVGKGFAVVAGEVKELAQETARATGDIETRIEALQADAQAVVDTIARVTEIIAAIHESQTTIATAVEEQTATTHEVNRNVTEAAAGSEEIAANIIGVADASAATTEALSQGQGAIDELARMAADLRTQVAHFTY